MIHKKHRFPELTCSYPGIVLVLILMCSVLLCACGKQAMIPKVISPSAEEKLFHKAQDLFQLGDYDSALTEYFSYLEAYPNADRADDCLIEIGAIYLLQEQFEQARYSYERLIREYPASVLVEDAHLGILKSYYKSGDYAAAFDRAHRIPIDRLSPSGRLLLFKLLGDTYLADGSASDAVYAYAMGYYYADSTQKGEVLALMQPAIRQLGSGEIETLLDGPDFLPKGNLMYQLAVNHAEEGQAVAAMDIFHRFLAQYPNHELAGAAYGFMNEMGQIFDDERYAIGCLLPLTGPYQAYGQRALKGIELALAQRYDQASAPRIRLVVKDSASNPERAVQAVAELYQAQVSVVIGPIITAKDAAEAAQKHGLPMIVLSGKEAIVDIGDYIFRNFITPRSQIETIVPYLCDSMALSQFAILYPDEKYGLTFMNLFWDEILENNGTVVGCESYPTDVTDFADPIKKLVGLFYEIPEELKLEDPGILDPEAESGVGASIGEFAEESPLTETPNPDLADDGFDELLGAHDEDILKDEENEGDVLPEDEEPKAIVDFDAVFIPDSPKKAGLIAPQLAYYDVENTIFVGTNLWHSKALLKMARKYVQNAVLADGFYAESTLPHVRQFIDLFTNVYGRTPGFIEAVSYDTASLLFDLISRPEFIFRYSLKEALINMGTYPGVTGDTYFDETGEAIKQLYLLQIKGGRFKEIRRSPAAETSP